MKRSTSRPRSKLIFLFNGILMALDVYGHAAVGVFVSNTRVIGLPETPRKALLLFGHTAAWPLFGLLQALALGGFNRFGRRLLAPFSPGRLWALAFTLLGLRSLAQEIYRFRHPRPCPPELVKTEVEPLDLRREILAYEAMDAPGLRGLFHRLNQLYSLELTTHELQLDTLPRELDGFTIMQLSDVHHSKFISAEFVRRYVKIALDLQPDLVALTGDFQTLPEDVEGAARLMAPFGEWSCRERGGLGALAVLGNHDREAGEAHVMDALRRAGIRVLRNEHVRLEKNGASLYVAGVADPWSYRVDLESALHGIPEGSCTVLLCHVPDYVDSAAKRDIALQLSGHNHGGQIKLPFFGALLVSSRYGRRYAEGLHKIGNTLMYANRGMGGKPSIRWGARPELTQFILRSSP